MFSWNIHSTWDSSQFVLTIPLHYIALVMFGFAILLVLLFQLKSGHGLRNMLITGAAVVFYGFLMLSSELRLDRASQTATLRRFQYYHWSTYTCALKDIDRIYVSTVSTTSQLNIQFCRELDLLSGFPRSKWRERTGGLRRQSVAARYPVIKNRKDPPSGGVSLT